MAEVVLDMQRLSDSDLLDLLQGRTLDREQRARVLAELQRRNAAGERHLLEGSCHS